MLVTEETAVPENSAKKASAVTIAILVHIALAIIFAFIAVSFKKDADPQIVAIAAPVSTKTEPKMEKKTVMKQVKQTSAASAASPIAKMIRANTTAKIAAPEVTKVSDGPLGLGEGDFGDGFGNGSGGGGMGSGAMFFGSKSTGKRFLFVLDHSGSMRPAQVKLRNTELEKALKALPATVQYNVLLFAGGAYFAEKDWTVTIAGRAGGATHNEIKAPGGKKYLFKSVKGWSDYEFDGSDTSLPKSDWINATKANVSRTMKFIEGAKLYGGTDWGLALQIGHRMDPAPEVIFFMSDGTGGNDPGPILKDNRRFGKPKINTFAMQTRQGAKEFNEIAEKSGGEFVIVLNDGKPIKGKDYLKDPGKYNGKLQ
jgi:hypothetical protein